MLLLSKPCDYLLLMLEDGRSETPTTFAVDKPVWLVFCSHGWYRSSASGNEVPVCTSRSMSQSGQSAMNCIEARVEFLSGEETILLGLKHAPSSFARSSVSSFTLVTTLESNSVEHFEGGFMCPVLHTLLGLLMMLFSSEIDSQTNDLVRRSSSYISPE